MAKLVISDRILLENHCFWEGGILIDDQGLISRLLSKSDVAIELAEQTFNNIEVTTISSCLYLLKCYFWNFSGASFPESI